MGFNSAFKGLKTNLQLHVSAHMKPSLRCTRLYRRMSPTDYMQNILSKLRYQFYRLLVMLMCSVLIIFIIGYIQLHADPSGCAV